LIEQPVTLLFNRRTKEVPGEARQRNFDAFDVSLNHLAPTT